MHAKHKGSASAAAPLDSASAAHHISGPFVARTSAERKRTLHVLLREVLDAARKRGEMAASVRAIARRAGVHHSIVAESLTGERTLTAERALLDPPLLCVEEFVDLVLAPRRAEAGARHAVSALLRAVERIDNQPSGIFPDEDRAVDDAITEAIDELQRIKRERRTQ